MLRVTIALSALLLSVTGALAETANGEPPLPPPVVVTCRTGSAQLVLGQILYVQEPGRFTVLEQASGHCYRAILDPGYGDATVIADAHVSGRPSTETWTLQTSVGATHATTRLYAADGTLLAISEVRRHATPPQSARR